MTNGKIIGVGIPIQGGKSGGYWQVGEAEIDDDTLMLSMDRGWTDLLTDMVKHGAQIEGITIEVRFRAANRKED